MERVETGTKKKLKDISVISVNYFIFGQLEFKIREKLYCFPDVSSSEAQRRRECITSLHSQQTASLAHINKCRTDLRLTIQWLMTDPHLHNTDSAYSSRHVSTDENLYTVSHQDNNKRYRKSHNRENFHHKKNFCNKLRYFFIYVCINALICQKIKKTQRI